MSLMLMAPGHYLWGRAHTRRREVVERRLAT
jgi:hypothetical protein